MSHEATQDDLQRWKTLAQKSSVTHLNAGGDGTVVAVRDADGTPIAVKYIPSHHKRARRSELAAIRRLNNASPHIVHTYGMVPGASGSLYVMQERAVCDLHDAAGVCEGRAMGEGPHVGEWMLQVAHGLRTCHDAGVAHRDVKPENLLLVELPEKEAPTASAASSVPTRQANDTITPVQPSECQIKSRRKALLQHIGHQASKAFECSDAGAVLAELGHCDSSMLDDNTFSSVAAKLCDFGAAFCAVQEGAPQRKCVSETACGSKHYSAPEIARLLVAAAHSTDDRNLVATTTDQAAASGTELEAEDMRDAAAQRPRAAYDPFPTDVWSFGMTLFALTSGLQPFRRAHVSDAMFRAFVWATQREAARHPLCEPTHPGWAQTARNRYAWRWPRSMSRELVDVLGRCLVVDPGQRASMGEVCGHAFFAAAGGGLHAHVNAATHCARSADRGGSVPQQAARDATGASARGLCQADDEQLPVSSGGVDTAGSRARLARTQGLTIITSPTSSLTWDSMSRSMCEFPGSPSPAASSTRSSMLMPTATNSGGSA